MYSRGTGTCCAVRGCTNNQSKLNRWLQQQCFEHGPKTKKECPCEKRYRFYRLPSDEESRIMWLKHLNLKKPPKTLFVCSFHFVDKRPSEENPHPTLWLGDDFKPPEKKCRILRRNEDGVTRRSEEPAEVDENEELCSTSESSCDSQTQWSDPRMEEHTYSKRCAPSPALPNHVSVSILQSDEDSLLYTGIPLIEFHTLVSNLQQFAPVSLSMPVVDQILMTLMKLRQNFDMADLARRFKTPQGLISRIVRMWIDVMSEHTKDLIVWLPRETIKATLPKAFKEHFSNTTCVIDCTETVVQKAKNLDSRCDSYSNYYGNNTVKYLVAVSPSGVIMFISDAYGGKCSDRYIIQNSGFLDCLRAGDEVMMGDSGFTIRDLLEERRVNLIVPEITHKGCQLTSEEVTRTRCIAHARIRVEQVIRHLKVYKILSQTVSMNLVSRIDKMLKICAGLVNFRPKLIST